MNPTFDDAYDNKEELKDLYHNRWINLINI